MSQKFFCKKCNLEFTDRSRLKRHVAKAHKKETSGEKSVELTKSIYEECSICHKKKPLWYSTEEDAINHQNGKCKKCLDTK